MMKTLSLLLAAVFAVSAPVYSETISDCLSMNCLKAHMAKMTRDTPQTLTSHDWIFVDFDNVRYDLGALTDVTNDSITIRKTGVYHIEASFMIRLGTQIGWCSIFVDRNSIGFIDNETKVGQNGDCYSQLSRDVLLSAGDTLAMRIIQASAAVQSGGSPHNTMSTVPTEGRVVSFSVRQVN